VGATFGCFGIRTEVGMDLSAWVGTKVGIGLPCLLPDVARVHAMKVLGVTISCSLSVYDHVNCPDRLLSPFMPCDFFEHTA